MIDRDVMIDVLSLAAERSEHPKAEIRNFSAKEFAIIKDLLDAQMIEGDWFYHDNGAKIDAITLQGPLFLEKLVTDRKAKSWPARFRRAALLIGGWLGGLLTAYAKTLIEHFYSK